MELDKAAMARLGETPRGAGAELIVTLEPVAEWANMAASLEGLLASRACLALVVCAADATFRTWLRW